MDNLQIEEELKKVVRRQDSIQKTLDLMYGDRSILEDIITRLGALENALHLNREHQTEVQKDLKADIQEVQMRTEDAVDTMTKKIDEKTVIIKSAQNKVIEWITRRLKGGKKYATENK